MGNAVAVDRGDRPENQREPRGRELSLAPTKDARRYRLG